MRTQALLALLRQLQIAPFTSSSELSREALRQHRLTHPGETLRESLVDYQSRHLINAAQIAGLSAAACVELATAFGAALTLTIDVGTSKLAIEQGMLITAAGQQAPEVPEVESVLHELTEYEEEGELRLRINKAVLLEEYRARASTSSSDMTWHCFLFTVMFEEFLLEGGLQQIDRDIFTDSRKPTVVVLADASGVYYEGSHLRIVSEDALAATPSLTAPVAEAVNKNAESYRNAVISRLSWDFQLLNLTPLHLLCQSRAVPIPTLSRLLDRYLFHLGVLFTANRTGRQDGGTAYLASYLEQDRAAIVALSPDDEMPDSYATSLSEQPIDGHLVFEQFARWAYDGEGRNSDRLAVLQKLFAQSLHERSAKENTTHLARELNHLLAEVTRQYDIFIGTELDKYFQQRQAAADHVAEAAKKVSESIDTLTKGLADTLLTTVAAVVAAFVAAATNEKLRGEIFTVALCAYGGYVFIQAVLRLKSATDSLGLLKVETGARLDDLKDRLGDHNHAHLEKRLTPRWDGFHRWLKITCGTYVVLIIAIVWLAFCFPETSVFQQVIATSPTPSQVTTPTTSPAPSQRLIPGTNSTQVGPATPSP